MASKVCVALLGLLLIAAVAIQVGPAGIFQENIPSSLPLLHFMT
jgi:hypothetical protein